MMVHGIFSFYYALGGSLICSYPSADLPVWQKVTPDQQIGEKARTGKTRAKHFPKLNVDISAGQLNVLMSRSVINNKWGQLRRSPLQLYQPWNGRSLRRVWTCSGWAGPPLRRVWDAWWDRTRPPAANSYLTKENKNRQIWSLRFFSTQTCNKLHSFFNGKHLLHVVVVFKRCNIEVG